MKAFSTHARELQALLDHVLVRVSFLRAIQLVDRDGLPLVSTLGRTHLDEALGALAGALLFDGERARRECETGPLYVIHLVARDRQIALVPVNDDVALAAIADAGAPTATFERHLFALSRDILSLVLRQAESTP